MRVRCNIFTLGLAGLFLVGALGAGGLVQGRPIEFSEPGDSSLTANVSGLGNKPADLPGVEERVFKPHAYKPAQRFDSSVKPLAQQPNISSRPTTHAPGAFDREKNWLELTPEEMLQNIMDRQSVKLPAYGTGSKSVDASDPYNLSSTRRRENGKAESRSLDGETNRWPGLSAPDPLAAFSSQRSDSPGNLNLNTSRPRDLADWLRPSETAPLENRRERMEPAGRLDDFKRNPAFQTPGGNPAWSSPATSAGRGNTFVSDMEKSSLAPGGSGAASFLAPTAPVAPTAPLAPGQTSLTPAQYSPPAKLKPGNISAPRRSF